MQAVILCGGLGTRLRGVVDEVPKPMAPFKGKPFLEYIIEQIKDYFNEIILLIGYKGEVIQEYFGDGSKWGVNIKYSIEEEPLGTGGAIKNAQELINDDYMIFNGDSYHELNYDKLLKNFRDTNTNTMVITRTINPTQVTIVKIDEQGIITEMKDQPSNPSPEDKWMNAGVLLLKKDTLDLFPEGKHSMERIVFPKLISQGMRTEKENGRFYVDIGTPPNHQKFKTYSEENL